jgi:hypothetical protein
MSDCVINVLFQYNPILDQAENLVSMRGEGYRRRADSSSAEETEYPLLLKSPKTQRWREMERTANGHTSRDYHSRSYS